MIGLHIPFLFAGLVLLWLDAQLSGHLTNKSCAKWQNLGSGLSRLGIHLICCEIV